MTVGSTISRVDYDGAGSVGPFPIPFYFQSSADINVTHISAAGIESAWALGVDFTLTGAGNPAGGALTAIKVVPVGARIVVRRVPPQTQTVDLVVSDDLPAEVLENAIDKLTMAVQALQEQVDRCVKLPLQDGTDLVPVVPPATVRRTRLFGWDADGNPQAISIGGGNEADALVVAAAAQSAANTAQATADTATSLANTAQATADNAHTRIDGLAGDSFDWTGTHNFQNMVTLTNARIEMARGSLAVGSTTDLAAVSGNYVSLSGADTITRFGSAQAGAWRLLRFNGVSTIVHGADIICPGGKNITTAIDDTAMVVSEGGGIWRIVEYRRAVTAAGGVFTEWFESGEQAIVQNTILTVPHGLGGMPRWARVVFRCLVAQHGHAIGDETDPVLWTGLSGQVSHFPVRADTTNLYVAWGDQSPYVQVQVAGSGADLQPITLANWRAVLRAAR